MQRRVTGPENGGKALGSDLKVGELVKWTQQWVGTSFRTGLEMEQAFSTDKRKKRKAYCTLTVSMLQFHLFLK
jgi:hypothetical protein